MKKLIITALFILVMSCGDEKKSLWPVLLLSAIPPATDCTVSCTGGIDVMSCERADLIDPCGVYAECLPLECIVDAVIELPLPD